MKWFKELLSTDSDVSSRRVTGMLLVLCAIVILVLFLTKVISIPIWREMQNSWIAMLTSGVGLLVTATADHFAPYSNYQFTNNAASAPTTPEAEKGLKQGEVDA